MFHFFPQMVEFTLADLHYNSQEFTPEKSDAKASSIFDIQMQEPTNNFTTNALNSDIQNELMEDTAKVSFSNIALEISQPQIIYKQTQIESKECDPSFHITSTSAEIDNRNNQQTPTKTNNQITTAINTPFWRNGAAQTPRPPAPTTRGGGYPPLTPEQTALYASRKDTERDYSPTITTKTNKEMMTTNPHKFVQIPKDYGQYIREKDQDEDGQRTTVLFDNNNETEDEEEEDDWTDCGDDPECCSLEDPDEDEMHGGCSQCEDWVDYCSDCISTYVKLGVFDDQYVPQYTKEVTLDQELG
jgi:hypothetical protein